MKKRIFVLIAIFLTILPLSFADIYVKNNCEFLWDYDYLKPEEFEIATVIDHISIDRITVSINEEVHTLRVIGIEPFKNVSESSKKELLKIANALCPKGSVICLSHEWKKTDLEGNSYAYIWYMVDGDWIMHNGVLISNGYVKKRLPFSIDNNYKMVFDLSEDIAKLSKRGLWGNSYKMKSSSQKMPCEYSHEYYTGLKEYKYYSEPEKEKDSTKGTFNISIQNTGSYSTPSERDAYYMSHVFLEDVLAAPSTAKYPYYQEGKYVVTIDWDEFIITAYVDAENYYGAKLRVQYVSHLKYIGNNKWRDLGTYLLE